METRVLSQASPCGIYIRHRRNRTHFTSSVLTLLSQNHSNSATQSFLYHRRYNLSNWGYSSVTHWRSRRKISEIQITGQKILIAQIEVIFHNLPVMRWSKKEKSKARQLWDRDLNSWTPKHGVIKNIMDISDRPQVERKKQLPSNLKSSFHSKSSSHKEITLIDTMIKYTNCNLRHSWFEARHERLWRGV